jgi:hypothetical protein
VSARAGILCTYALALLTALAARHTLDSTDHWRAVEQISWLVGIVGLPVALVALGFGVVQVRDIRDSERSLANETRRRPLLTVGFAPTHMPIPAPVRPNAASPRQWILAVGDDEWNSETGLSQPHGVAVLITNRGDRTADDVRLRIDFPDGFDVARDNALIENDPMTRLPRRVASYPTIHPGDEEFQSFSLRMRRDVPTDFTVRLSMRDYPAIEQAFRLRSSIRPDRPPLQAPLTIALTSS